jgi:hypothetical protein
MRSRCTSRGRETRDDSGQPNQQRQAPAVVWINGKAKWQRPRDSARPPGLEQTSFWHRRDAIVLANLIDLVLRQE